MTLYPNNIDSYLELPPVVTGSPEAITINALIDAIIAIETELGKKPRGVYNNTTNRLSLFESRIGIVSTSVFNTTVVAPSFALTSIDGPMILTGIGAPLMTVPNGSIYLRQDGNINTTIYIRQSGAWSGIGGNEKVRVIGTNTTLNSDDTHVSCTSGGITVTLPITPLTGEYHEIKDANGNSGSSSITVNGNGNTIDGALNVQLVVNYTALTIRYNGTNWSII